MKILITERQLKKLLNEINIGSIVKNVGKSAVKEIPDVIQNVAKLTDSLGSRIGRDKAEKIEALLLHAINLNSVQGGKFVKSIDGSLVPTNSLTSIIDGLSRKALSPDEVLKYLPDKLANGTSFKKRVENILSLNMPKNIKNVNFDDIVASFTFNNCIKTNCPNIEGYLSQMVSKIPNTKFQPSKVKVKQKSFENVLDKDGNSGLRQIIELELDNKQSIIMYSSSGSNVKTTGKKAGEWFAIPGWGSDGFYLKTDSSVALTKGGNKYLTDLAQFLEKNGIEALG